MGRGAWGHTPHTSHQHTTHTTHHTAAQRQSRATQSWSRADQIRAEQASQPRASPEAGQRQPRGSLGQRQARAGQSQPRGQRQPRPEPSQSSPEAGQSQARAAQRQSRNRLQAGQRPSRLELVNNISIYIYTHVPRRSRGGQDSAESVNSRYMYIRISTLYICAAPPGQPRGRPEEPRAPPE